MTLNDYEAKKYELEIEAMQLENELTKANIDRVKAEIERISADTQNIRRRDGYRATFPVNNADFGDTQIG